MLTITKDKCFVVGMALSRNVDGGMTYWTCGIHKQWDDNIRKLLESYEHYTSFHEIGENEGCKKNAVKGSHYHTVIATKSLFWNMQSMRKLKLMCPGSTWEKVYKLSSILAYCKASNKKCVDDCLSEETKLLYGNDENESVKENMDEYILERDAKEVKGNDVKEKQYVIDFDKICDFFRRSGATDKSQLHYLMQREREFVKACVNCELFSKLLNYHYTFRVTSRTIEWLSYKRSRDQIAMNYVRSLTTEMYIRLRSNKERDIKDLISNFNKMFLNINF